EGASWLAVSAGPGDLDPPLERSGFEIAPCEPSGPQCRGLVSQRLGVVGGEDDDGAAPAELAQFGEDDGVAPAVRQAPDVQLVGCGGFAEDLEYSGQGLFQVDGLGLECGGQELVVLGQVDSKDRLCRGC